MLRSLQTTIKVAGTVLLFLALERVCAWSGSIFHADGMTGGSAAIHSGSNYHIAPENPGFDPIYLESDEPPWWGPPGMDPFEEEYYYRYRRPPPPLSAMWEQTGHNLGMPPPPPFHHDHDPHRHYYPGGEMEYRRVPEHPLEQGGGYVSRLMSGRTALDVVDAVVVQSTSRSPDGSSASSSTAYTRPYSSVGSQTQPDAFRKEPPRVQTSYPSQGSGDPASSSSSSTSYRVDGRDMDNNKQLAFAAYDMRQKAAADFERNRRNREFDERNRQVSRGVDEKPGFTLEKKAKDDKKEKRSRERKDGSEGSSFGGIKEKLKSKLSDSKGIVKGQWKTLAVAFKGGAAGFSNQIKNLASQVKSTDRTWGESGDLGDDFDSTSAPSEPPSLSQAYSMFENKATVAPSPAALTEQSTPPTRTTTVPRSQSKPTDSTKKGEASPTPSVTTSRSATISDFPKKSSASSSSSQPSLSQAYSVYDNKAVGSPSLASKLGQPSASAAPKVVPSSQQSSFVTSDASMKSSYSSSSSASPFPSGNNSPASSGNVKPSNERSSGSSSSGSSWSSTAATSGTSPPPAAAASSTRGSGPVASSVSSQKESYSAFGSTKPKSPEKYNPFNPWNPQGSGASSSTSATDSTKSASTSSNASTKSATSYSSSGTSSSSAKDSSSWGTASSDQSKKSYSAFGSTKPAASEASNPFSAWNPQGSSSTSTSSSSSSTSGSGSATTSGSSSSSVPASSTKNEKASYSAFGNSKPKSPEKYNPFNPWNPQGSTASASSDSGSSASATSSSSPSRHTSTETQASAHSTQQKGSYSAFGGASKPKVPETSNPFSPWNPQGASASASSTGTSGRDSTSTRDDSRTTSSGNSASAVSSVATQKQTYSAFGSDKPKSPEKYNPFNPWNPQGSTDDSSADRSPRSADERSKSAPSSASSYSSNSPASSPATQQKASYSAFGGTKPKAPETSNPFSPWNPPGSTTTEASSSDLTSTPSTPSAPTSSGSIDESESKSSERYNPFNPWNPQASDSGNGTPKSSSSSSSTASQKSSFSAFGSAKPKAPVASNPFSPWNPQETASTSTTSSSRDGTSSTRDTSSTMNSPESPPEPPNPFSPWNPQTASASSGSGMPETSGHESSSRATTSTPTPSTKKSWNSFGSKPQAPTSNHALGGWNAAHSTSSFPTPAADSDDSTRALGSVRSTPTQLGASNSPSASHSPSKSYSGFGNKPRAPATSHSLGGWVDQSSSRGQFSGGRENDASSRIPTAENGPVQVAASSETISSSSRTGSNAETTVVGGASASFLPSEPVPPRTYSAMEGAMPASGYGEEGFRSPQMAGSSSDRLDRGNYGIDGAAGTSFRESEHSIYDGEPPSLAKTFVNFDSKPRDMNTRHLLDGEPPSLAKSFAFDNRPRPAESSHYERYIPSPAVMDYGAMSNHYIAPEPSRTQYSSFDSGQMYADVSRPMVGNSNAPSWVQSGVKSPTFYSSTPTPASAHTEEGYTAASPSSPYAGSATSSFSSPYASSFGSAPPMRSASSRVEPVQSQHSSPPMWSNDGASNGNVPAWVKGGVSDSNFFTSTPSHSSASSGNSGSSPVYSPPSIATPIQRSVAPAINYGSSPAISPSPSASGLGDELGSSNKMSFDSWAVEGSNAPTWVTNGVSKANFYSPAPSMLSTSSASPSPARSIRGKAPEAARQFTGDWDAVVSTNTPTWVTGGVSKENFYSPAPSNSARSNPELPRSSSNRQSSVAKADGWNELQDSEYSGGGDVFLTGPYSRSASPSYGASPSPSVTEKRFDKDGAYPTASNSYGSLAPFSAPPRSPPQSQNRAYDTQNLHSYGDPASISGFPPLGDSRDPFSPIAEREDFRPEHQTDHFKSARSWESSAPSPAYRESLDGAYPTNTNSYGGTIAPYARTNFPDSRTEYARPTGTGYREDRRPRNVLSSGTEGDEFRRDGVRSRDSRPMHVDSNRDFLSGNSGDYDSSYSATRPAYETNGSQDRSFLPQSMQQESSYSTRSAIPYNGNGLTHSYDESRMYSDSPNRADFSPSSPDNGYQPLHYGTTGDRARETGQGYGATFTRDEGSNAGTDNSWSSSSRGSSERGSDSTTYNSDSSQNSPGTTEGGGPKNYQAFGGTVRTPERHALGAWSPGQSSSASSTGGYESSSSSRGSGDQSSSWGSQTSPRDGRVTTSGSSSTSTSSRGSSSTSSSSSSSSSSSTSSSSSLPSTTTPPSPASSAPAPSRPKSYSAFGSKPKAPSHNSNAAFGGAGGYLSGF